MPTLPHQKQWVSGAPAYTTKQHCLTDNTFRIIFVLFGKTRKNIHRVIPKKLFHVHRAMLIAFVVCVTSAPHLLALEVFLCVVPRHLGGGVFSCLPQVTGREDWNVLLTLMMSVWFLKFESSREQQSIWRSHEVFCRRIQFVLISKPLQLLTRERFLRPNIGDDHQEKIC